jgi:hypothetical protein
VANAYNYSNTANPTTLAGNISAGATTVSVVSVVGFPAPPYVIAIDYGASTEELAKVTGVAGLALTVERGFGSTSAQSHSLGAVVRPVYNAVDATDFRTHEDSTAAHGATGAIVGTTNTQTLTNKTLTSPTVNTPAITSPTMTGGGSLAGTYTGTPTFSGDVVLSGSPTVSGLLTASGGALITRTAGTVPLIARGAASQSADIFRVENNSSTSHLRVDSTGATTFAQPATFSSSVTAASATVSGTLTASAAVNVAGVINDSMSAIKSSDTTRTSSSLTADPELSISIPNANALYRFEAFLIIYGDGDNDINVQFSDVSGSGGGWTPINYFSGASGTSGSPELVNTAWGGTRVFGLHPNGITQYGIHVMGGMKTNGSSGTITLNWGTSVAGGDGTTVGLGSWMKAERLA